MIIDKIIFNKHLEKGETILYSVHQHWVQMMRSVAEVGVFGFVLPWGFYFMGFNTKLFFMIAVIWSVLAYIRFIYVLIDWYCDAWLITNMSVITVQWNGIFSNNATRLGYEDIEGAAYEISGFWGTILRYGTINMRFMSGNSSELKNISHPKKAELLLAHYKEKFLSERNMHDTGALKTLLANLVANVNKKK